MFISFEGIDGAGKSSHIASVAGYLEARGHEVVLTREPGGTALAEQLRTLTLNLEMDSLTEALLMFVARRDHLRTVIEPALARGAVVITDRFTDSTFAYQGAGRGFDLSVLRALEDMVQQRPDGSGLREPDVTLWFDVSPEAAAERLAGARVPDKFEAMPVEFFRAVRRGYIERMASNPRRVIRIQANQQIEDVRADVLREIRSVAPVFAAA